MEALFRQGEKKLIFDIRLKSVKKKLNLFECVFEMRFSLNAQIGFRIVFIIQGLTRRRNALNET